MGDLKLFARNDYELESLLTIAKGFSNDIGMEFGLDKCAEALFLKGTLRKTANMNIDVDTIIRELDPGESYKY